MKKKEEERKQHHCFILQSFQMLWVSVHPSLLPINFHPLIIPFIQVSSYLLYSKSTFAMMNSWCELGKTARVKPRSFRECKEYWAWAKCKSSFQ